MKQEIDTGEEESLIQIPRRIEKQPLMIKFSCKESYLDTKVRPWILKGIQNYQGCIKNWLQGSKPKSPFLSSLNGTYIFLKSIPTCSARAAENSAQAGAASQEEGLFLPNLKPRVNNTGRNPIHPVPEPGQQHTDTQRPLS